LKLLYIESFNGAQSQCMQDFQIIYCYKFHIKSYFWSPVFAQVKYFTPYYFIKYVIM
jgi:hypothetical protein